MKHGRAGLAIHRSMVRMMPEYAEYLRSGPSMVGSADYTPSNLQCKPVKNRRNPVHRGDSPSRNVVYTSENPD